MGFFDQRPSPPQPPEMPPQPVWAQPEAVLPGVVADTLILARTADAAVVLGDLRAYPNGYQFTVTAYLREAQPMRRPFGVAHHLLHAEPGPLPDDLVRFGLRYADGTVLTNLDRPRPGLDDEGPRLLPQSGTGLRSKHVQTYWAWPLPPPGRIDVVCEWPGRGIPETTVPLDAAVILTAAARCADVFES